MAKDVILTGIRSNDEPTIGNYLGAFLPIIDMANKHAGKYQINMFVPDLHSFTTPIDHDDFYGRTKLNLKLFVACGLPIDNENVFIYRQSYIPAHADLAWILSCFTGFGEASRMVEFKDKSQNIGSDRVTVGLFNYPILMAADILLYGAKWVPVGDDQRQHLEFIRNLAIRLNNKFGNLFVVPESTDEQLKFSGRQNPVRIRSLRNPEKKMSKSIDDPAGTIMLSDKPEVAAGKLMTATTDDIGSINYDWEKQPGITNILQILSLLSGKTQSDVNSTWEGRPNYSELKAEAAEVVRNFISKLQGSLVNVDEGHLVQKLETDEKAMNEVANQTLLKVQKAVGLRPS